MFYVLGIPLRGLLMRFAVAAVAAVAAEDYLLILLSDGDAPGHRLRFPEGQPVVQGGKEQEWQEEQEVEVGGSMVEQSFLVRCQERSQQETLSRNPPKSVTWADLPPKDGFSLPVSPSSSSNLVLQSPVDQEEEILLMVDEDSRRRSGNMIKESEPDSASPETEVHSEPAGLQGGPGAGGIKRAAVQPRGAIKRRSSQVRTPGSYNLVAESEQEAEISSYDNTAEVGHPATLPGGSSSASVKPRSRGVSKLSKQEKRQEKERRLMEAVAFYREGNTLRDTANKFALCKSTIANRASGKHSAGQGRKGSAMTRVEEVKLAAKMDERNNYGVGLDHFQAALIFQKCLKDLVSSNSERVTGFEDSNHFPDYEFVRRFAARNNLVLRVTTEMKKGKEQLKEEELRGWFEEAARMMQKPEIQDIMKSPARVFNFDETNFDLSGGRVRVLAKKGRRQVPGRSSGSRNHSTLCVTVNGAGDAVDPRFVLEGSRDVSGKYLKDLQPGTKIGRARFS